MVLGYAQWVIFESINNVAVTQTSHRGYIDHILGTRYRVVACRQVSKVDNREEFIDLKI
jgi:hypothetical protein